MATARSDDAVQATASATVEAEAEPQQFVWLLVSNTISKCGCCGSTPEARVFENLQAAKQAMRKDMAADWGINSEVLTSCHIGAPKSLKKHLSALKQGAPDAEVFY